MKLLSLFFITLSLNAFAIDMNCNLTDQEQAMRMSLVGENDVFTLNDFLGSSLQTSLDGGLLKAPYVKDNNYQIEISNECDNLVHFSFYDKEVQLLQSGEKSYIIGYMVYESESVTTPIHSPVRCIKK